jgi:hypothetical protein
MAERGVGSRWSEIGSRIVVRVVCMCALSLSSEEQFRRSAFFTLYSAFCTLRSALFVLHSSFCTSSVSCRDDAVMSRATSRTYVDCAGSESPLRVALTAAVIANFTAWHHAGRCQVDRRKCSEGGGMSPCRGRLNSRALGPPPTSRSAYRDRLGTCTLPAHGRWKLQPLGGETPRSRGCELPRNSPTAFMIRAGR